jgi:hypothetical protein
LSVWSSRSVARCSWHGLHLRRSGRRYFLPKFWRCVCSCWSDGVLKKLTCWRWLLNVNSFLEEKKQTFYFYFLILNADWGCAATRDSIVYHSLICSMVLLTLFCCNLRFVLCSWICRIGYISRSINSTTNFWLSAQHV